MVNFLKIKQLKTDCLRTFKDISSFMDSDLKDLRYMRKSFGYLVYNSIKYIVKHNGKNAIVVNKEDKFVSCKPFEESYHVELLQVVRVQLYWSSHVWRELVLQLLLVFLFNYNE